MEKKLRGNLWKYTLMLITNKRAYIAILGTYYMTIPGVTPWWVGAILFMGSMAGFILEIPSGYISDKMGHKMALIVSKALMVLSTLFFLIAKGIPFLVLGSVFFSASLAFQSGTGSAFMHETLRGLGREHEYSRVMGKISSMGFAVPIVLMVLVPFLVELGYKAPFLVALAIDTIGLIASISLSKPAVPQEHIEEIGMTNFRQVAHQGYRLGFYRYALFSGIVAGVLVSVGSFRAPYQSFLEIPVIWFGVLFGVGRVFASLMLAYSGKIRDYMNGVSGFYRSQLVLYIVLFVVLGTVSDKWAIAFVFIVINAFQWGLSRVDEGYLLDIIRTSKFKATLLSMQAQIEVAVTAVSSVGLGLAIERLSYSKGYICMGIVVMAVLIPLYFYVEKGDRERRVGGVL